MTGLKNLKHLDWNIKGRKVYKMFKDDLYEVVRGALSKDLCQHLDTEFELLKQLIYLQGGQSEENKFMFGDSQVTNSFAHYGALCFESLALQMQPLMEKITCKSLYPTYTYARIYYNEATMAIHKDRPSCEFSATINITIDKLNFKIFNQ